MNLRETLVNQHGEERVLEDERFMELKKRFVQQHGLASLHFHSCQPVMSSMSKCGDCGGVHDGASRVPFSPDVGEARWLSC